MQTAPRRSSGNTIHTEPIHLSQETMKTKKMSVLAFCLLLLLFLSSPVARALDLDGVLLLSFKYAILGDSMSVLGTWNYDDATPCSWNGVTCAPIGDPGSLGVLRRVTSLALPSSKLLGSIPPELGLIEHLAYLDLSNNLFNGSLPDTVFNSSSLRLLNLSRNALVGHVPGGLLASVEVLDLSSNLLNGSLPSDLDGSALSQLNLSHNSISGAIPAGFGSRFPNNATIDLSFNNLTGSVPESLALLNQKTVELAGNSGLCGKPLEILCSPHNSSSMTPPAIAVIPKPADSVSGVQVSSPGGISSSSGSSSRLKPGKIAGIVLADLTGIGILSLAILYVYQLRKRKSLVASDSKLFKLNRRSVSESKQPSVSAWPCIPKITGDTGTSDDATSTSESDSEEDRGRDREDGNLNDLAKGASTVQNQKGGLLVTIDKGETKLELDTLLRASAYVLGGRGSGGSIVYKAVLENGAAYAVRRIGEAGVGRLRDFETRVKAVAKLRHRNLVGVRGFYWGDDGEKLVIYDYIPNGSLDSIGYRKGAWSPFHMTLETRLKIATGVARGLAYTHEKKQLHGNVKPSNILLGLDMEPVISDLGLDRLTTAASRNRKLTVNLQGYRAPESLTEAAKPTPNWDVYSYGIVVLELFTGRVFTDLEVSQWSATMGWSAPEDRDRFLRAVDPALRADAAGREDAIVAILKLGFNCASLVPHRRPSMKEAVQVLEKIL
ncbi:hypothetical protein SAY87_000328 [Trapa incisa]|uniref:Protein kinase domain-containing protein n=1 Tax=Trapa incisa TaxID=236973 RepID=A0AAN7JGJ1_9MYRT|nr:hypothetical protein SAY87_000328 [Trapa incisa]